MSREINNVYWEDVQVKQDLPEKSRVIDTTLIAMGATWATHDFMPVHHDRDFAQSKGAPDIFMNILTSNGLMMTYLEQWAGPQAVIKDISIRLSVPNFPRDRMDMNARITRKWEEKGEHLVEVAFNGDNQMGPHAAGTAIISLPTRG
ncbi:MAG: acyl dehydratase [Gammaproteobacteria bacterium]|nr:acyl dehydratase [Gammaproteobacteria bacterium]